MSRDFKCWSGKVAMPPSKEPTKAKFQADEAMDARSGRPKRVSPKREWSIVPLDLWIGPLGFFDPEKIPCSKAEDLSHPHLRKHLAAIVVLKDSCVERPPSRCNLLLALADGSLQMQHGVAGF